MIKLGVQDACPGLPLGCSPRRTVYIGENSKGEIEGFLVLPPHHFPKPKRPGLQHRPTSSHAQEASGSLEAPAS